jgi:hypothetical protein
VNVLGTVVNRRISVATVLFVALAAAAVLMLLGHQPSAASAKGKSKGTVIATKTFTSSTPDQTNQRYEVYCPKGTRPFGGGVTATPPVQANGDGVFPTSSERLGKQEGWHITVVQHGPGTYQVTLQVLCRKFKGDIDPVENVLGFHADPGQSVTIDAKCPGKQKLISGGFLTSQFFSAAFGGGQNGKGVYVTESRALGPKAWRVTAMGVPGGGKGGQFNPIAYCFKSKKALLKEVVSPPATAIAGTVGALGGSTAKATTPSCSKKHPLGPGGYSTPADGSVLTFDTNFSSNNTFSASAAPFLAGGPVTAYGYCMLF